MSSGLGSLGGLGGLGAPVDDTRVMKLPEVKVQAVTVDEFLSGTSSGEQAKINSKVADLVFWER